MGVRLDVVDHEPASVVMSAYRQERDPVRRSHLHVVALLLSGEAIASVSRLSGFSERWVQILVGRWNVDGVAGLGDRRRRNAGAEPLLDEAGLAALAAALEEARRLVLRRDQPAAATAAPCAHGHAAGAGGVQKKLRRTVATARRQAGGRGVEVWAFDEHRLGLKPLRRRVWARRGQRPIALSHHKYRWLYLYGFVHP